MIHGYERANATDEKEEGAAVGPPAAGEAPSADQFFAAIAKSKVA